MAFTDGVMSKVAGGGPAGQQLWMYKSTQIHTDVAAANYFPNNIGLRVDDVVIVTKTSATIGATLHVVTEVSSDGATVSAAILS